ncbi:MerR family transcriptional regulator [Streptomyces sp. bgisy022]|uniref:MerR family transcriptional regulator n=1 Tax=Streptomyces sp. bgisy022 TaxID=3413769 RepID=UPI003D763DB9
MRIGELAATVGVTTRAVRHYHHLGLLPEPERLSNGYRNYTLRHAVVLARIRRLTELGLGLAEVRDVLADDAGKDLAEVLTELDEDLARQEAAIRERRGLLRALLDTEGGLTAGGPVSPELAALFQEMTDVSGSPSAAKDREVLALIESTAPPEERERFMDLVGSALSAPGARERAQRAYALLDELVDAGTDDPRVDEAVELLATALPEGLVPEGAGYVDQDHAFLRALYADFAPAQAEVIRRMLRRLGDRPGRTPAAKEEAMREEATEGE